MIAGVKQSVFAKRICAAVIVIIFFFFTATLIRTFTRQILVKRLGMANSFTNIVLFDVHNLDNAGKRHSTVNIDWQALYPFKDDAMEVSLQAFNAAIISKYTRSILSVEELISTYVTDYLIGYKIIVALANKYEDAIIQWAYAPYAEYNAVIKLSDGLLTSYIEKRDVEGVAENTIIFANYCKTNGIDFVYAQAPHKISEAQDSNISGVVDFSNQNANALIERLQQENIDVYDFRAQINTENLDHHSLFYRTDHHWKVETGLWAARHILEHLSEKNRYDVDPSLLSSDQFTTVLYPSWFLGSQGKKVTLSVTTPDDFSLLYPVYDTRIHFSIPDAEIDMCGDFSVVYDMSQVEKKDYYGTSPYEAFMYGDHALARFENLLSTNDLRLLFIHDSFGDCVLPFVSLGVRYVDSLDLRNFTGSVQTFIEENKPDAVIVLYTADNIRIKSDPHRETFDFR
ncbi:MAG: hypothetical protein E7474_06135 [Ruminococcaceae bacterium]|nr:hypothetical protein [Oscillospiraceae bacterium]